MRANQGQDFLLAFYILHRSEWLEAEITPAERVLTREPYANPDSVSPLNELLRPTANNRTHASGL